MFGSTRTVVIRIPFIVSLMNVSSIRLCPRIVRYAGAAAFQPHPRALNSSLHAGVAHHLPRI